MEFISLKIINYSVTEILIAFGFTIIAGLSTGLGSLIAISTKRTNTKFLSISLGFSWGNALCIVCRNIFKAKDAIILDLGENSAHGLLLLHFWGMVLIALIDKLIPKPQNPHEASSVEELEFEFKF